GNVGRGSGPPVPSKQGQFVSSPHVQLIIDRDIEPPGPLRAALNRVQAQVSLRSFDKALSDGISSSADLCVVLPGADRPNDVLDAFMARASDRVCGTILIPADTDPAPGAGNGKKLSDHRLSGFDRPVAGSLNTDELAGRIKALWEIRRPFRRMQEELKRLRNNGTARGLPGHDFDEQIRLASQIQNDLLPDPITDAGPLEISTLYLPADFVSGDTYDIARLDEDRFGFSLADATGHGLPAALLAILVKNSLRGKDIHNNSYYILEPDELFIRLNRELLATNLRHCHFITALYAIFDRRTNEIRWARGGAPYPILFRPGEAPRQVRSDGGLLGVIENQAFEVARLELRSGDILLFHTDGLDALLLGRHSAHGNGAILRTRWMQGFSEVGPETALDEIRRLAAGRDPGEWSPDDITALAIRFQ
ncbi:MAG TPA: PP2C family protein-serine/threonine phosphatase, partial [Phycisphaerae bacterium]|nr:PP2C family protein-serine/threonine phosphatase [Phycisphaerae bacterium]